MYLSSSIVVVVVYLFALQDEKNLLLKIKLHKVYINIYLQKQSYLENFQIYQKENNLNKKIFHIIGLVFSFDCLKFNNFLKIYIYFYKQLLLISHDFTMLELRKTITKESNVNKILYDI